MKLKDITFKDQKEFEFLNPLNNQSFNPKVFITILSPSSKQAKNLLLQSQRKIFELMQDENNLEDGKPKAELIDLVNKKYVSSLIVDWKNITDDNDKKLVVNEANKIKVIENEFVFEFVGKHYQNLENFR